MPFFQVSRVISLSDLAIVGHGPQRIPTSFTCIGVLVGGAGRGTQEFGFTEIRSVHAHPGYQLIPALH